MISTYNWTSELKVVIFKQLHVGVNYLVYSFLIKRVNILKSTKDKKKRLSLKKEYIYIYIIGLTYQNERNENLTRQTSLIGPMKLWTPNKIQILRCSKILLYILQSVSLSVYLSVCQCV